MMLLDKQLEPYGVTWMECEEIHKLGGKPPYHQYTFKTPEEFEAWKNFCIEQMRNTKEKLSKKRAEKEFYWLQATYGLKEEYRHA